MAAKLVERLHFSFTIEPALCQDVCQKKHFAITMTIQKIMLPAAFFVLACFVTSCAQQSPGVEKTGSPAITLAQTDSIPVPVYTTFNEIAPLFALQNDTTYVINFWATWCKPCVAELPYFEQLYSAHQNEPVKVLLVSLDFAKQIKTKLIPFLQERNLQTPVAALLDGDYNAWIDKVSPQWDGAIPFTLIYKKDVRRVKLGEMSSYDELEQMLLEVKG
jgi:thiol-disulfide isomerase/thioredoxin